MFSLRKINELSQRFVKHGIKIVNCSSSTMEHVLKESQSSKMEPHTPVLCSKVLEHLNIKSGETYIDMTFGAGGHSRAILESGKDVKIIALDRDPVAIEYAKLLAHEYPENVVPILGRFSDLPRLLHSLNIKQESLDGILFDFGCSSMQFDEADRGFSVSKNGPLDMRMDRGLGKYSGITAADVLAKADEADLIKILRVYGQEKQAKKIARTIIETRAAFYKIETTKQLADLVASCINENFSSSGNDSNAYRMDKLQRPAHYATKSFQALRIFVNNELNEINYGMIIAEKYLKTNGRLVTITFHSLEDTIVKRHINGNVIEGLANPVPLKYSNHALSHDKEMINSLIESKWKQINKRVIVPDEEEVSANPRSRSAKLRAAIKIR